MTKRRLLFVLLALLLMIACEPVAPSRPALPPSPAVRQPVDADVYLARVEALLRDLGDIDELYKANCGGNPLTNPACRRAAQEQLARLRQMAADLQALQPPQELAAAHGQLLAAMGDYAGTMDMLDRAWDSRDLKALAEAGKLAVRGSQELAQAAKLVQDYRNKHKD